MIATVAAGLLAAGAGYVGGRMVKAGRPGKWFTWSEFEQSPTAARLGIDNRIPDDAVRGRIRGLVTAVLDPFRTWLGRPARVNSGFRARALNAALRGASATSQHMTGEAADLTFDVPGVEAPTSEQRAALFLEWAEANGIEWDQLIWYDAEPHVHVSFVVPGTVSPATGRGNRREVRRKLANGSTRIERPRGAR